MSDPRTMSRNPARKATSTMISSGAFPKVAFRRPPTASPVRVASCSVARTMSRAMGTIASAAEKKTVGGDTEPACSRATVMGMNRNSQSSDGTSQRFIEATGRARVTKPFTFDELTRAVFAQGAR